MTVEIIKRQSDVVKRYLGVERIVFLKEQPFLKIVHADGQTERFIRTDDILEVICTCTEID